MGQAVYKAKYFNLSMEISFDVINDLIPDVMFGNDFLEKDGVTLVYIFYMIFADEDKY